MTKISIVEEEEETSENNLESLKEQLLEKSRRLTSDYYQTNNDFEVTDLPVRRAQIIELFEKHQFKVTYEEDTEIISLQGGLARLRPPYRHIEANNVIVLDRLTSLLNEHMLL